MNKVILKTALVTLASLALAALLVFSLWILISPQTMASSCEKTGNYSFAVTCADLRYKYTKDVDDLARCAQDSIAAHKDKLIVKYCEKLIADEGFDDLCVRKDESVVDMGFSLEDLHYKSFICGNLSAAQYRTGNTEKAIETAKISGNFSALVIEIVENGRKDDAKKALEAMNSLEYADKYVKGLLEEFINEGD